MGRLQAEEMGAYVDDGIISRRAALKWHLESNHYPSVSQAWVPVAERAIEIVGEGGDTGLIIETPPGFEPKTVAEVIEGLHLESFLPYEEIER
jgi:hypothetical protein